MFVFILVGAISPGPVNIIAASSGASFGFIRTIPHVLGATISYTVVVFLVGIGLNHVLVLYPQIIQVLQYLAAGFLLYMSYRIATASPAENDLKNNTQPPSLWEGALVQGLNPKAWLVSMSGVSLFVASQSSSFLYLSVFCLISFVVCFVGVGIWAAIGHVIRQYLSNEKHQAMFNWGMGLLLSTTVLTIFIST